MEEILQSLAAHTGISVETARTALGAVLGFLKGHLPENVASQLSTALPGSDELVTSAEEGPPAGGGGLFGAVAGLASKVLGGGAGDTSKFLNTLAASGLSLDQAQAFLPKALELLKAHLPPEVFEKVEGLIPALGTDAAKE